MQEFLPVFTSLTTDGVNVKAYTAWSLMDNFEWSMGYAERFGLSWVNFTDPNRPIYFKDSGKFYKSVAEGNSIESNDAGTFSFMPVFFMLVISLLS